MEYLPDFAREYKELLGQDRYRPTYHFAEPAGNGYPGDPNGAFYANGEYHLMYLYRNEVTNAYHWGHITSADLVHWRWRPDALWVNKGDEGAFSGGAFVDDDGAAYLSFWKFPAADGSDNGGVALTRSLPPYDEWERMEPIAIEGSGRWGTLELNINGETRHIGCADPGNIWKRDGKYYLQTGNKCVLDAYGRDPGSPAEYRGDWTDLFRSGDLRSWEYVGRFYVNRHLGADWPDETEDDMCPSFLPLPGGEDGGEPSGKWLQLFISHNKGAQYYIGELRGEEFVPEKHGRFSYVDNTCFAPEALVDGRGRQLAWYWLTDNRRDEYDRFGWTGVYSFPRSLWYEDGELHMAPAKELSLLERAERHFSPGELADGESLEVPNGESFRLRATAKVGPSGKAGFRVRFDERNGQFTEIYYSRREGALVFDATKSGQDGRRVREAAPLRLAEGEELRLDIFVDRSVVEVYANNRQAICRRVYPSDPVGSRGVLVVAEDAAFREAAACEMAPANWC